ncbi:hypothetical protein Q73A0000_09720 [Kaistella flava (ex Peng et al. 2021)]|uniref:Acyltransferase n=1 Tax=Kaistella flava (ex Peng et al. 2021) TaxID=2038776 RepID=A0A7M2Y915_9FLAO|nr:hypothetical protein [Kaistella flava (ex Peng et al. 2021)]QOW10631.1 hypothetical protein Q73A0000_09720 [Kaistella flava (ex Peng et al. 2021)]
MQKVSKIIRNILENPKVAYNYVVWEFLSLFYSRNIDEGGGRIVVRGNSIKLEIKKGKNAQFNVYGRLTLTPFAYASSPITISIADGGVLNVYGDFMLGEGVRISVANKAILSFGGKDIESASGITGKSLIMANKKIEIGKDFICAWDVFITDSDWHTINDKSHQKDVIIGDHVWIANNSNILKGSVIGNNCIVSSCSKVGNTTYGNSVMIGGMPAKVLKENVSWKRDII